MRLVSAAVVLEETEAACHRREERRETAFRLGNRTFLAVGAKALHLHVTEREG